MQKGDDDDGLLRAAKGGRSRPILKGWLFKRESKGIKGYAKRWIELRDNKKLYCFKKPELQLRCTIDLSQASTIATNAQIQRAVKRTGSQRKLKLSTAKSKAMCVFKVVTPGNIWKLKAGTLKEHDEWVTALRRAAFGNADADPLDTSGFESTEDKFGTVEDLQKLSKNLTRPIPNVSDRFFNQAADLIDDLFTSLIDRNEGDEGEREEYMTLLKTMFRFCNDCIASFSSTWKENKPENGMSTCLILINLINEILNGTYAVASYDRDDQAAEEAFTEHVRILVRKGIEASHRACIEDARAEAPVVDNSLREPSMSDEETTYDQYIVTDRTQMLLILQKMEYYLNADVVNFAETFQTALSDIDLEQMYAEYCMDHVWTDAKMSLLAPSLSELKQDTPTNQDVWDLFKKLEHFYEFLNEFHNCGPSPINLWATPFVDRWLQQQNEQAPDTILSVALVNDKWRPIDLAANRRYSTSLNQLFKLLENTTAQFVCLPHNQDHLDLYIDFLSRVIMRYLETVFDMLETDLAAEKEKKEDWGYFPGPLGKPEVAVPEQLLVRINNIYSLPGKLKAFLDKIDLQKLFANCYGADRNIFLSPPAFKFNTIFNTAPDMLSTIRKTITEGSCAYTLTQLSLVITKDPEEGYSRDDLDRLLLVRCWNDLMPKLDQYEKTLYESFVQDLFEDILEHTLLRLEKHLLAEKTSNVLSVAQTVRVMYMVDIFTDFLKSNHLDEERIENLKVRTRIKVLTELLVSGSQRIITYYKMLQHNEETRGVCEAFRLENPPYIDRRRLWKVLNWRHSHIKDKVATEFINNTKKPKSPIIDDGDVWVVGDY